MNVLDAMGGLLGSQVTQLAVGEMELLILAAGLHYLGMVYTEEEKRHHYNDAEAYSKFLQEYCPEYIDCRVEDWTEIRLTTMRWNREETSICILYLRRQG